MDRVGGVAFVFDGQVHGPVSLLPAALRHEGVLLPVGESKKTSPPRAGHLYLITYRRYGYRRIKAMLRTCVSEKVISRIMAEDGLTAHVPRRRRYSSYEGETTPAPDNLVNRGCHYRWPGWLDLMERYGLTRSMSAKGCSSDNAAAEGFFGRMKTESVYPEHGEEYTRDEVLVLIDDCIRWYNHERINQSLGWMSPVQYRQSQGMAA